jgi:hypothetical protein
MSTTPITNGVPTDKPAVDKLSSFGRDGPEGQGRDLGHGVKQPPMSSLPAIGWQVADDNGKGGRNIGPSGV